MNDDKNTASIGKKLPCACGKPSDYSGNVNGKIIGWCSNCVDQDKLCKSPISQPIFDKRWESSLSKTLGVEKPTQVKCDLPIDSEHEHGHMALINRENSECFYWPILKKNETKSNKGG